MKSQDISLEKPFFELGNSEKPNDESLMNIGQEKINSLKNAIVEIEAAIEERESLSKIVANECDKIKMSIDNFLMQTQAIDSEDFKERTGLRQKQVEVSELQLNEKIGCWKDVALLKKELRECKKELSEKEGRLNMFSNILDTDERVLKGGGE